MLKPKVFLTKVWGFDPKSYPVLGFSQEGTRNSFLRDSSPGDWVVLAGTMGSETPAHQQGRLLGKVQLGQDYVDVESVLNTIGTRIKEEHFDTNGVYNWPFGLPMIEAEAFVGNPDTKEVLGDYLQGMVWASTARDIEMALGDEAWHAIMNLDTESIDLGKVPEFERQKVRSRAFQLSARGGNTGPGPSSERSGSKSDVVAASCYLLNLKGTEKNIYKVGYTKNLEERVAKLNKGLLASISELSWELELYQRFESAEDAYNFEQLMHKKMSNFLLPNEREIYEVKGKEISTAWTSVLYGAKWGTPK